MDLLDESSTALRKNPKDSPHAKNCFKTKINLHDSSIHRNRKKKEAYPSMSGWNPTRNKTAVKAAGYKLGIWTVEEIDLLIKNVDMFCQENNIADPAEVIFKYKKDERKNFYKKVSQGINRPVQAVYKRLLRMYDETNNLGKYSDVEIEKLKSLRKIHGRNWQEIGKQLGRSPASIKDKCRNLETLCSGKWTEDEENRLASAVHAVTGTELGSNVCVGIDWQSVAREVQTRSEFQCRAKWCMQLNWRNFGGRQWTHLDDKNLVRKIAELNPANEIEIDWVMLAKDWDAARSAQWLRTKWRMIKHEYKNNGNLKIGEFCKYLLETKEFMQKQTTRLPSGSNVDAVETIWISSNKELENFETNSNENSIKLAFLPNYFSPGSVTTSGDECDGSLNSDFVILADPALEIVIGDDNDGNEAGAFCSEEYTREIYVEAKYTPSDEKYNQMVKNDVPLNEITVLDDDRDAVGFNSPLHCLANVAVDHEILLDDESIFSQCLMNNDEHV
ncbi:cyclin-D-binding Myb-like transcription factor 1 isoform X2 [Artemia franciscana]|uniref:cyclin-D-binding Myb-like transcription factor 1 isoform X2 n=1 Tax=Artemia franciscana TaxID=6661 RepID=UPI0032DBB677